MPQPYNNAVTTDAGIALLNKVYAGQASLQFTRMVTGDGEYAPDEKDPAALRVLAGLKSERNSYPLSSITPLPGGGVNITALLSNQDPVTGTALISEGYRINEIGLYAKDKESEGSAEVLYGIATSAGEGDYMPPYNGNIPVQIVQEYHVAISGTAEVSAQYSGAVMLKEEADEELEGLREALKGLNPSSIMKGSTADKGGEAGLVPAPEPGAQEKFLCGDGTWKPTPTSQGSKGETGEPGPPGPKGEPGIAAGFGTPTATVDANVGTPSVVVTATGDDTAKVFHFDFKNLKGETGTRGEKGEPGAAGSKGADGKNATVTSINAQLATNWSGTAAPYTQTITVSGVTASSIVALDVASEVTAEQLDAYINAKIVDGGQATDSLTLKAFGDKPTVDIPIKVSVLGV